MYCWTKLPGGWRHVLEYHCISALDPSATLTLGCPPAGLSYRHIMGGKAGTGVSREALCAVCHGVAASVLR